MSKRVSTYAKADVVEKDGLKVYQWTKKCPVCKKEYITSSRGQRYCCDACCQKDQKRKRRQQKEYDATKEIQRLSARAHSLAVATLHYLVSIGLREEKCEMCGETKDLDVHHIGQNWLDGTPQNLQYLCTKCHSKVHSELAKQEKQNIESEEQMIYNVILK